MSQEFLQKYHIPHLSTQSSFECNETKKLEDKRNKVQSKQQEILGISNYSRYIPSGKTDTDNLCFSIPRAPKRKATQDAYDKKVVIFDGRDPSYPNELNVLINPLSCELCNVKMNSYQSAASHYHSKAHDRKMTAWLAKYFPEHPPVKRLLKEGPTGPDALHCELCDLPLTSLAHANQHYAGRKHRLVLERRTGPSGAGFEGKWIRTGSGHIHSKDEDCRFGIGEDFLHKPKTATKTLHEEPLPEITIENDPVQQLNLIEKIDDSLCCQICKISVTSVSQMKPHIDGSRHRKNLAKLSIDPSISLASASVDVPTDSILASINMTKTITNTCTDLSMYRTPTGSYYCKICDISLCHISPLQDHIVGKKHTKKVIEDKLKEMQHNAKK